MIPAGGEYSEMVLALKARRLDLLRHQLALLVPGDWSLWRAKAQRLEAEIELLAYVIRMKEAGLSPAGAAPDAFGASVVASKSAQ